MGNIIDDIAQLSEHIGPRPAGTEEEQQAALYIADELQKDAGFSTVIEDFNCLTNGSIVRTICFAIGFLAALVSLVVPAIEALCFVLGALSAVLYVLEMLGKDILSRFFHNGVSQNVVAKYQPVSVRGTSRSRKIILVANYDSEKEDRKFQTPLAGVLDKIRLATLTGLIASPVFIFIKMVFLPNDAGVASAFFTALLVVCLVLMALPLIDAVLRRVSPYNQAANNNAAGVGVLLETARTIGNGLVSEEDAQQRGEEEGTTVHGKEAAREAGVLPQNAEVEYEAPKRAERELSPEESLAAAKAAIAALTGRPVADKVPVTDIASKLVQAGQSADAESANVHFEVDERVGSYEEQEGARDFVRERVFAEDGDESSVIESRESAHIMPREQFERAQEQRASQKAEQAQQAKESSVLQEPSQSSVTSDPTSFDQTSETSFTRERPEALRTGQTGMGERISKTPAWAKTAQAKAHANKPGLADASKSVARSRFADTPAAHLTDEALAAAGVAVRPVSMPESDTAEHLMNEETPSVNEEETQQPMTELEARLAALRSEIEATQAPHVSHETRAALDRMEDGAEIPAALTTKGFASGVDSAGTSTVLSADTTAPIEAVEAASPVQEKTVLSKTVQQHHHQPVQAASTATAAASTVRSDRAKSLGSVTHSAVKEAPQEQHFEERALKQEEQRDRVSLEDSASISEQHSVNRQKQSPVQGVTTEAEIKTPSYQNNGGSTEAISPIDVSALLNKETKKASVSHEATLPANESDSLPSNQSISFEKQMPEQAASEKQAVSPIVGMETVSPLQSASIPRIDVEEEHHKEHMSERERQVIVLPDVATVASAQSDEGKQRAPMAANSESTQSGSKALLSNMLPRIDEAADVYDVQTAEEADTSLPPNESNKPNVVEHNTVSATGSFSIIGTTGSFGAVGDDLIADLDPEDLYVNDADDSDYDQEYTETGAFAGSGYVDMPKSRAQRLFGRFRSKKKKNKEQEQSMTEWINADEAYDARSVGKARGSWESFRNEEASSDDADRDIQPSKTTEAAESGSRDWNGGAFSLSNFRKNKRIHQQQEANGEDDFYEQGDSSATKPKQPTEVSERPVVGVDARQTGFVGVSQSQNKSQHINEELKKLRNFRFPGIDTEVWFVALGAEYANNSGMQAFMNEHADELKGSLVINLEALGAGKLTLIDEEGLLKKRKVSSRIKKILRNASEQTGIGYASSSFKSRNTTSLYVKNKGHQALTLMGMEDGRPALYGSKDDIIDNVDEQLLTENAAFVMALLKNI